MATVLHQAVYDSIQLIGLNLGPKEWLPQIWKPFPACGTMKRSSPASCQHPPRLDIAASTMLTAAARWMHAGHQPVHIPACPTDTSMRLQAPILGQHP